MPAIGIRTSSSPITGSVLVEALAAAATVALAEPAAAARGRRRRRRRRRAAAVRVARHGAGRGRSPRSPWSVTAVTGRHGRRRDCRRVADRGRRRGPALATHGRPAAARGVGRARCHGCSPRLGRRGRRRGRGRSLAALAAVAAAAALAGALAAVAARLALLRSRRLRLGDGLAAARAASAAGDRLRPRPRRLLGGRGHGLGGGLLRRGSASATALVRERSRRRAGGPLGGGGPRRRRGASAAVPSGRGVSVPPPCFSWMAAMSWLLRIRPVPLMPRLGGDRLQLGQHHGGQAGAGATRTRLGRGAGGGVAGAGSVPGASERSSVVSLTKGPSQGSGVGPCRPGVPVVRATRRDRPGRAARCDPRRSMGTVATLGEGLVQAATATVTVDWTTPRIAAANQMSR